MATANKNLFPDLSNPNAEYYQVYKPTYSTTPSYAAPTSYSGQQSSLGNITGVSADKTNAAYTGFADNARASGTAGSGGQVNMYTAPNNNVYNTSNMTPQQIHALSLNKENNPNAAAILSGMGLDINGNQRIKSPWEEGLDRLRDGYAQRTGNTYNYQTGAYTSPTGSGSGSAYSVPQNGGYIPPSTASAAKGLFTAPTSSMATQQSSLQQQAAAQVAAQRAAIASAVNQQLSSLRGNMDYTQQLQNDSNVLEDVAFQRNNNPFSGRTGYAQRQTLRDRGIENTALMRDYNTQASAAQQQLADFDANSAALTQQILNELTQQQMQNDMNLAQLTGNYNGQRTLAGSAQDANLQNQQFNQNLTNRQANLEAALQVGNQQGRVLQPKDDWSNLYNQADAPLNTQGQQLAYQQARDAIADKQYQQKFDEDVRRYGLDYGLQQAQLQNQISNSAADNARQNAALGLQREQFEYEKANPQTSSTTQKTTDYKTNPDFASDISFLKSNPNAAAQLDSNAEAFISAYGYDGYLALRKAANLE
jgi:hypothetical protein